MAEYSGLDEIIKLGDAPAFDPLIIEEVYFSKLDWEIDRAIGILKYRLANAGITDYEMVFITSTKILLMLKGIKQLNIKSVYEEYCPSKTIYVLTSKINGKSTIRPLDRIGWQEFFIQIMAGKQPKLTTFPMWAQARITWK